MNLMPEFMKCSFSDVDANHLSIRAIMLAKVITFFLGDIVHSATIKRHHNTVIACAMVAAMVRSRMVESTVLEQLQSALIHELDVIDHVPEDALNARWGRKTAMINPSLAKVNV